MKGYTGLEYSKKNTHKGEKFQE